MENTKAQHTPGPWKYEQPTKTIRSMPGNYWLATMDSWDGAADHAANAALIAAAPELLEMLKKCIEELPGNSFAQAIKTQAEIIIAKAEGK